MRVQPYSGMLILLRREMSRAPIMPQRWTMPPARDEIDLKRCLDYVHIHPVKDGLVGLAGNWPESSFHRYVNLGEYPADWGGSAEFYGDEFEHAE